ncbi:unnamed protein product [Moneuplotes crassus]|uniref:Uncharacterized protein n=1 Tax=Euplotes crassus TaxID=5936 RepID=A0AAD2D238_EUPCR|nr:unnamed protein product [Moneuplotes crassus]
MSIMQQTLIFIKIIGCLRKYFIISDQIPVNNPVICRNKILYAFCFPLPLNFKISHSNMSIAVFAGSSAYDDDKESSISTGGTKTVSIDWDFAIYIVVHPTSSSNAIDIDYKAERTVKTVSVGAVIGIVLGSICCFIIIIGGIIGTAVFCSIKKAQMGLRNQAETNNGAATAVQISPQPQMITDPAPQPLYMTSRDLCFSCESV